MCIVPESKLRAQVEHKLVRGHWGHYRQLVARIASIVEIVLRRWMVSPCEVSVAPVESGRVPQSLPHGRASCRWHTPSGPMPCANCLIQIDCSTPGSEFSATCQGTASALLGAAAVLATRCNTYWRTSKSVSSHSVGHLIDSDEQDAAAMTCKGDGIRSNGRGVTNGNGHPRKRNGSSGGKRAHYEVIDAPQR